MRKFRIVFDVCTPNGVIIFTEDNLAAAEESADIIGVDVKYIRQRKIINKQKN